ncbi:hypothetical protein GOODEAATRI_026673 [Goodea atripinnis]|uniref:Ycf15 n=1 Tax=Goodea atripinnis TaxID=208336 RepID=A0ABV0NXY4_9TELE
MSSQGTSQKSGTYIPIKHTRSHCLLIFHRPWEMEGRLNINNGEDSSNRSSFQPAGVVHDPPAALPYSQKLFLSTTRMSSAMFLRTPNSDPDSLQTIIIFNNNNPTELFALRLQAYW